LPIGGINHTGTNYRSTANVNKVVHQSGLQLPSLLGGVTCRMIEQNQTEQVEQIFMFVDRASLYNLVNKVNMVHNFS